MGFDPRQRRADVHGEHTTPKENTTMTDDQPGFTIEADNKAIRAEKMAFLRSTTTTTVDRNASDTADDVTTSVEHLARFAIEPGFVEDQRHDYGVQIFRPTWLEVTWVDGLLRKVRTSGRRVLKSGKLQEHSAAHPNADISRERTWQTWNIHKVPFDRAELPHNIERRIADYETDVAVADAQVGPEQ